MDSLCKSHRHHKQPSNMFRAINTERIFTRTVAPACLHLTATTRTKHIKVKRIKLRCIHVVTIMARTIHAGLLNISAAFMSTHKPDSNITRKTIMAMTRAIAVRNMATVRAAIDLNERSVFVAVFESAPDRTENV